MWDCGLRFRRLEFWISSLLRVRVSTFSSVLDLVLPFSVFSICDEGGFVSGILL